MRLAFAVAAHLEPEILLVDEVLAVGDAAFQKKCLGKMDDVARGGRTVLFVSHNMAAIRALCSAGLLLRDGTLVHTSSLDDAVSQYAGFADIASEWRRPETQHANGAGLVFQRLWCEVTGDQPNLRLSIEGEMRSVTPHAPAFLAFDVLDSVLRPVVSVAARTRAVYRVFGPSRYISRRRSTCLLWFPGPIESVPGWGTHYAHTLDLVDSSLAFTIFSSPTPGRTYPHN